jgi:PAS domain S-box-containing protein
MGRHDRAVPAPEVEHYLKEELYRLIRQDPRIFEFIDQGSLDGIWYWDIEHPENEWYSPGFCALFGYREGEFPPTSAWWQQNIHPDDLALTLANFKKHEADPRVPYDQVVRYRHRDGSTVWVRCRGLLIRDEAGKPIRMLGAHTDLTDLKRTEAALRQSEERYRTLATASPVGMFRTDAEGRCTYVNERWCEISGLSPEQALGEGWVQALDPRDRQGVAMQWTQAATGKTPFRLEYRFRRTGHADGTVTWVLGQAAAERDRSGNVRGYVGTNTDVTDRKRAEEQARQHLEALAHVSRLSTMGQMATGLAHELNQPLGAMSNLAFVGRMKLSDDPPPPAEEIR